jgi:hypothetical protein
VESIAGDEAAAAELDRLARLMEQQAILEKVRYATSSPEDSLFSTKKNSRKLNLFNKIGTGHWYCFYYIFFHSFLNVLL